MIVRAAVLSVLVTVGAHPASPDSAEAPALKPGLYANFQTSEGVITAQLYEKYTPKTVANFVALAQGTKAWRDPKTGAMVKRPLYNNTVFHRVIKNQMIQGGDPTGTGRHECGVSLRDEILPGLKFGRAGKLAMANSGEPDSGGCQFFLTNEIVTMWDGKYTIFGEVVSGQEVVSKISNAPQRNEKPDHPARLFTVTIERIGGEPKRK